MNKKLSGVLKSMMLWVGTCMSFHVGAQAWVPVGNPDFSAYVAQYTSIAINQSGVPYVVYEDLSSPNEGEATVMSFNGSNWAPVGNTKFSDSGALYTCIAIDGAGTPYVAFVGSYIAGDRASVMKYNGSSWVNVGNPGFSDGGATFISLAIAPDGTPYVAYMDYADSNKATVMKYNGSAWVTVGRQGLSAGEAEFTTVAIAPDGTPYVAYTDYANDEGATVMSYNGSNWVPVGSLAFSGRQVSWVSIAINAKGTPYVAYNDFSTLTGKASVMSYTGGSWEYVGSPQFSVGVANYTTIAISPDGTPYVAYRDETISSSGATVMQYNGTNWTTLGNESFSPSDAAYTSIAINPLTGIPYVAFSNGGTYNDSATVMMPGPWLHVSTGSVAISSVTAFPNPNSGTFTLHISETANENANVTITNVLGERVSEYILPTNTGNAIQLRVAPGMYFVTAVGNNTHVTTKITIE